MIMEIIYNLIDRKVRLVGILTTLLKLDLADGVGNV